MWAGCSKRTLAMVTLLFLALAGTAISELTEADFVVMKTAPSEVNKSESFNYTIEVHNYNLSEDALDVVVTDKLPDDVIYNYNVTDGTVILDPNNPEGDIFEVQFDNVSPNSFKTIIINVTAPSEAPVTLYNHVFARARNGPNIFNESVTYVKPDSYNKSDAIASFEELLISQADLLFSFEDMLHALQKNETLDQNQSYELLTSFEQLLRTQTKLQSSFAEVVNDWDGVPTEDRVALLLKYEMILKKQGFLMSSFESALKIAWDDLNNTAEGHTLTYKQEFLASFEDLIKRQAEELENFEDLEKILNKDQNVTISEKVELLQSFEYLLRLQANLIMSFEDLLHQFYGTLDVSNSYVWIADDQLRYKVSVKNNGPFNAKVLVKDYYPIEANSICPGSTDGWVYNANKSAFYTIDSLPSGGEEVLYLCVHIPLENETTHEFIPGPFSNYVHACSDVYPECDEFNSLAYRELITGLNLGDVAESIGVEVDQLYIGQVLLR